MAISGSGQGEGIVLAGFVAAVVGLVMTRVARWIDALSVGFAHLIMVAERQSSD